jgi:AcrR family transcriptional regulator
VRNRTSGPIRPEARDRRVLRTKASLRSALIDLAHEKPYDSIAVKEILDRANIGRSTFYTHFQDKDELLASGIDEMLQSIQARPRCGSSVEQLIAFSLPILEYIARHRHTDGPRMRAEGRAAMHEHLRRALTNLIAQDVEMAARRNLSACTMPPDLVARHVASTFVLVLNWWVDNEAALLPAEVDARFRALVLPVLATL